MRKYRVAYQTESRDQATRAPSKLDVLNEIPGEHSGDSGWA